MIGSPLALMASCHLALAVPNFLVCEFHAHDVPFFHDLMQGGTESWFRHGWVIPSNAPGYGIELEEAVAKHYQLAGTRWFA
jgi:L-alanine-DL-glutamate epimerase-like enolase superfamily enzyme